MRLQTRDYPNMSNIIVALTISMFLLLPPKSYNFDPSKSGFKPVEVWMRSSIPAAGQIVSFYKNCEATDQRLPWYIKYYSGFDHFHVSTTPPSKSHNFDLSKPGDKPVEVWLSSYIPAAGQIMSLHKNFEALDERLPQYIKYYSTFDHFHVSTPTSKIL